jgi:hypothetical protein
MERPDEKHFLQHINHFQVVDPLLENFCVKEGFELDKNLYRTPCRVLRKKGSPKFLFDFYQEGNWLDLEYSDNLAHTFAVAGYYHSPTDESHIYKLEYFFAKQKTFAEISEQLQNHLTRGFETFELWTPKVFEREGNIIKNPKKSIN